MLLLNVECFLSGQGATKKIRYIYLQFLGLWLKLKNEQIFQINLIGLKSLKFLLQCFKDMLRGNTQRLMYCIVLHIYVKLNSKLHNST